MLTFYISSGGLRSQIHPRTGADLSNGFPQSLHASQAGEAARRGEMEGREWSRERKPAGNIIVLNRLGDGDSINTAPNVI